MDSIDTNVGVGIGSILAVGSILFYPLSSGCRPLNCVTLLFFCSQLSTFGLLVKPQKTRSERLWGPLFEVTMGQMCPDAGI